MSLTCYKPRFSSKLGLSPEIKAISPSIQHGEGPFWDVENNELCYVDTFTATIYRWSYDTNTITSLRLDKRDSVGVIIGVKDKPNEFIVGADRHIYKIIWKNDTNNEIQLKMLLMMEPSKPHNQFNDGKVDGKGRLWIGTLTRNEDLSVESNGGSLYMITGNDSLHFYEKITHTSISNGLAWSGDSKFMYYIDSKKRTVISYAFDETEGNLGTEKVLFDLHDHPELKGIPDGMTIDSSDNLWIALFGGHSIINVDSKTGHLKRVIKMPATYVTSACFGGPQLDILYVTTSKLHLTQPELENEPLAGSVFAVSNLEVKGVPSNKFILN